MNVIKQEVIACLVRIYMHSNIVLVNWSSLEWVNWQLIMRTIMQMCRYIWSCMLGISFMSLGPCRHDGTYISWHCLWTSRKAEFWWGSNQSTDIADCHLLWSSLCQRLITASHVSQALTEIEYTSYHDRVQEAPGANFTKFLTTKHEISN